MVCIDGSDTPLHSMSLLRKAKPGAKRLKPNEGQEGDSIEGAQGAPINRKPFFGETESTTIRIYVTMV